MDRLIDRARMAAWSLARDVVLNERDIDMSMLDEDEVAVVVSPGAMTVSMDVVLELAGMLNALQAMAEDRVDLVRLFQRRHGEACASALALGLQMVGVAHLGYKLIKSADDAAESIRELKAQNEDFLVMRDDAFRGRKDAEAENAALREQAEEWKRKYEAKVYHNE